MKFGRVVLLTILVKLVAYHFSCSFAKPIGGPSGPSGQNAQPQTGGRPSQGVGPGPQGGSPGNQPMGQSGSAVGSRGNEMSAQGRGGGPGKQGGQPAGQGPSGGQMSAQRGGEPGKPGGQMSAPGGSGGSDNREPDTGAGRPRDPPKPAQPAQSPNWLTSRAATSTKTTRASSIVSSGLAETSDYIKIVTSPSEDATNLLKTTSEVMEYLPTNGQITTGVQLAIQTQSGATNERITAENPTTIPVDAKLTTQNQNASPISTSTGPILTSNSTKSSLIPSTSATVELPAESSSTAASTPTTSELAENSAADSGLSSITGSRDFEVVPTTEFIQTSSTDSKDGPTPVSTISTVSEVETTIAANEDLSSTRGLISTATSDKSVLSTEGNSEISQTIISVIASTTSNEDNTQKKPAGNNGLSTKTVLAVSSASILFSSQPIANTPEIVTSRIVESEIVPTKNSNSYDAAEKSTNDVNNILLSTNDMAVSSFSSPEIEMKTGVNSEAAATGGSIVAQSTGSSKEVMPNELASSSAASRAAVSVTDAQTAMASNSYQSMAATSSSLPVAVTTGVTTAAQFVEPTPGLYSSITAKVSTTRRTTIRSHSDD